MHKNFIHQKLNLRASVKIGISFFFLLISLTVLSQNAKHSLSSKSFTELIDSCKKSSDILKKEIYLNVILEKAKKEKDTAYLLRGYHLGTLVYKDDSRIEYCDSLTALGHLSPTAYYPTTGYLIKGSHFFKKLNFKSALDNYLLANKYARLYTNEAYIIQSNYYVGLLKGKIGEHSEALKLHLDNYKRIQSKTLKVKEIDYLRYLFEVANTYNELKEIDSASYYNSLGIEASKKRNNEPKYLHFVMNEGVTQFYNKNYLQALDSLNKSLPHFESIGDHQNSAVGYFYAGKSYLELNQVNEAVHMFKKVDTVFIEDNYILPKLRENYEILINYYKEKSDVNKHLTYVTRLLKLDSILNEDELYINKKIIKEYDTPKLLLEKEIIIHSLQHNKSTSRRIIEILLTLLLITIVAFYYQFKKRKTYKQRFLKLIDEGNDKKNEMSLPQITTTQKPINLNMSNDIINDILHELDAFETNQIFVKQGINLNGLAKKIQTNANYLSKVVNHFKKQSFINYLNGLRIDFAVDKLKSDHKFRRYTIKAIAQEVGFSNTQSFSKAFFNKTGIKPSYFIKELEKMQ